MYARRKAMETYELALREIVGRDAAQGRVPPSLTTVSCSFKGQMSHIKYHDASPHILWALSFMEYKKSRTPPPWQCAGRHYSRSQSEP